jgi:hypothetical protein
VTSGAGDDQEDSMKKMLAVVAAAGLTLAAAPAATAGGHSKPDTECMRAGIATLKDAGLLSTVAKDGIGIGFAVDLGVTVRPGADISGVPDPIPFSLLLADHRAGDDSLFVYPWC